MNADPSTVQNHRCCERCWFDGLSRMEQGPSGYSVREVVAPGRQGDQFTMPVQVVGVEPNACCVCGGLAITGIFIRQVADGLACGNEHDDIKRWSSVRSVTEIP